MVAPTDHEISPPRPVTGDDGRLDHGLHLMNHGADPTLPIRARSGPTGNLLPSRGDQEAIVSAPLRPGAASATGPTSSPRPRVADQSQAPAPGDEHLTTKVRTR